MIFPVRVHLVDVDDLVPGEAAVEALREDRADVHAGAARGQGLADLEADAVGLDVGGAELLDRGLADMPLALRIHRRGAVGILDDRVVGEEVEPGLRVPAHRVLHRLDAGLAGGRLRGVSDEIDRHADSLLWWAASTGGWPLVVGGSWTGGWIRRDEYGRGRDGRGRATAPAEHSRSDGPIAGWAMVRPTDVFAARAPARVAATASRTRSAGAAV